MTKKRVFAVALAVCLIAILSLGSLAWFTDSDQVDNEFLIAGSQDGDKDKVFSVDVWEKTPDNDKDQDGYTYENILPGDILPKEVRVENTGAYEQYIRVIVVVSNAAQWQEVLGYNSTEVPELSRIVGGYSADKWEPKAGYLDTVNNNIWYELYYTDILAVAGDVKVFESVKVPESLTREQAAAFRGGFDISVAAQAVQTQNLGVDTTDNVNDAYEAFVKVNMTAQAAYEQIIAANP